MGIQWFNNILVKQRGENPSSVDVPSLASFSFFLPRNGGRGGGGGGIVLLYVCHVVQVRKDCRPTGHCRVYLQTVTQVSGRAPLKAFPIFRYHPTNVISFLGFIGQLFETLPRHKEMHYAGV